ncbi:MAG: SGNH hydrolase domain-containing protein [Microthrixaceae bacterium]
MAALLATRGIAAPSSFLTETRPRGHRRQRGQPDPPGCKHDHPSGTTGPGEAGLLVGDSIAASLESALSAEFASRGASFASIATPGCGVITGVPANGPDDPIREVSGKSVAGCPETIPQRQSDAVASFHPGLVIAIST